MPLIIWGWLGEILKQFIIILREKGGVFGSRKQDITTR